MLSEAYRIAEQILNSKKTCVLTGAGISTESGIPDFRSPGGIWSRFDPYILSRQALEAEPERFFTEGLALLKEINGIKNKQPNKAHYLLAKLEQQGMISCIITQNIDGLHQKAGSSRVLEVHGNLNQAYCKQCRQQFDFNYLLDLSQTEVPPRCACGGIIRPGVVLFGDPLGPDFQKAEQKAVQSDMMLVIGSSLEVSPVNRLPELCGRFIIINLESTTYDCLARMVWHQKASAALEDIYKLIAKD